MGFQEKLKELRLEKGISQKKLADSIGVAQSSINYWERGERTPSTIATQKLADYFNISVDELLDCDFRDIPADHHRLFTGANVIAAHFDGDEYTEEELDEIRQFAEFVKNKRKNKE